MIQGGSWFPAEVLEQFCYCISPYRGTGIIALSARCVYISRLLILVFDFSSGEKRCVFHPRLHEQYSTKPLCLLICGFMIRVSNSKANVKIWVRTMKGDLMSRAWSCSLEHLLEHIYPWRAQTVLCSSAPRLLTGCCCLVWVVSCDLVGSTGVPAGISPFHRNGAP